MTMTSMVAAIASMMAPVPVVISPVVLHVVTITVLRSLGLRTKRCGAE